MAIGNHNDLTHIVRTSDQWKNTYDKYELIPVGVLCVELVSSDVTKIKIGDGHNIFSKLPYIGDLDLGKYYTKLETDTRIKEILTQEKVVRIKGIIGSKSDLPAEARCGDIYFVRQLSSSDNKYIEYIYSPDNTWEPLGGIPVDIDLSEYAKTAYVDDKIEQVNERIDDIEQHGTHTHSNKEILDQITEPYTTADKETLASLHNYDDTEIREMISQSSHTHANKDILDATSAAFTREDKSKLDQLNPYDDSTIKERITELERVAHEHSNKRILDQTTASFTKEYERKMRWIRLYTGCTGMEEGIAGLVPAAQAGEEDYVLSGSGEWVPQTGGGGTYELPIATTSTLGGIKVGDGLEIDANGKLSVVGGGGGGDSIAEGDGITITTDPQTGVKTISVDTGNGLQINQDGELEIDPSIIPEVPDYRAGDAIEIKHNEYHLSLTDYSNNDFIASIILSVTNGTISKAADNSSFVLSSSFDDCYTRGSNYGSNGSYPYTVKPLTQYRLQWDSASPGVTGYTMIFENGEYTYVHVGDQGTVSYIDFTTAETTTFIQVRFGIAYAGNSISISNIRLYEYVEDAFEYEEINVKYNKGLIVNQDNELEVNIGTGLEIDPQTGAINVTGGSGGGDTVEAGDGIDIDTDSQTGNKVISVSPATQNSIGGIKIGDGLSIDENGVASAKVYEAGQGIVFDEATPEGQFKVRNLEYYFDNQVSCQIDGTYGPRTFTRVSQYEQCLAVIWPRTISGQGWTNPLFVGLTENSVKLTSSADSNILGPSGSFEYRGYTWYYTCTYGLMNSSGVDLLGNLQTMNYTDSTDEVDGSKHLIDLAGLVLYEESIDVWNSGTGWLNGAYNDGQSDQFWTNWYYTYHSKQNEYLEVPAGAIKMRQIGISNENDSRLQGGGVDCFNSSHHHFTTIGCITDEWADIPEGTVYLQFGVKWNELNNRTISSSDIKSVTIEFYYDTPRNDVINAKLGNGLEFDSNDAIQAKLGSGLGFDSNGALEVTGGGGGNYSAGEAITIRDVSSTLPAGYVEVDYIEGVGNYTVINYIPNRKTKVVGTASQTQTSYDPVVFGNRTGSNGQQFVFWFNRYDSTRAKVGFVYGTNTWSTSSDCDAGKLIPYTLEDQFTFLISLDDEFNINDSFVHNITENGAPASNLKLGIFALVSNSSDEIESSDQIFRGRMYEFKIYEDDELVVNLIPAISTSTNQGGFYDVINDIFYTSKTATPFGYDPSTIHSTGKVIDVNYGNGLTVNQNNELEINTGDGLSVNANGEVELSKATANALGGIKIGSGFVYTSDGLLNATPAAPPFDVGDGLELIYDDIDALPNGYGHVDYVCSNPENNLINAHGRARTLIDYIPTNTTKLAIKMQRDSERSDLCFIGSRIASRNHEFCFWNEYDSTTELAFSYGGTNYSDASATYSSYITGQIIEVECVVGDTSNTLSVNGTVIKTYTKSGDASPYKLGIFQLYLNESWAYQPANGKIYYIKLYEGDTLAVNLIPAVRLVDEAVGFYDNINDKFYTSNTEYPFTTDMTTLVIDGGNRTLKAKLGNGLRFDSNGAIEATGGGGGDSIAEGDGIEITTDQQTGVKTIGVNVGNGLEIDPITGALNVTGSSGGGSGDYSAGEAIDIRQSTLTNNVDAIRWDISEIKTNGGPWTQVRYVEFCDSSGTAQTLSTGSGIWEDGTAVTYSHDPAGGGSQEITDMIADTRKMCAAWRGPGHTLKLTFILDTATAPSNIVKFRMKTGDDEVGRDPKEWKIYVRDSVTQRWYLVHETENAEITDTRSTWSNYYNFSTPSDTSINVKYGTGLSVDPITNELFVDGQLPEGTIIKKLTYVGDGSTTNSNIHFSKKPLSILSLNGLVGQNYGSVISTPIDAPYLHGVWGGSTGSGTSFRSPMSYDDTTNTLSIQNTSDVGLAFNISGVTYTMFYLTKGHTGSGTSVNNEVSVVKTFSYTGTGTSTNNIQFPETPDMILSVIGENASSSISIIQPIEIEYPGSMLGECMVTWGDGISGSIDSSLEWTFDDTTNVLSLLGDTASHSSNISGKVYVVRYVVNEVIASTMPYDAGEAISIEMIGGLQPTNYSNDDFVDSIVSMNAGSIVKAADKSSFTITASRNDCYTRGSSGQANGSYPFNVKASTKYRFAWDSADPTVHGKVYTYENGLYDAMMHEIDQYDSSYLEFITSPNTTFIQARFGVMYGGDSITYSNVRLYEVIEDEDQYNEISVKHGDGLIVNERNELEVNYGNGLEIVSNSQYRSEYYFNTQVQCQVHTDNYYSTHSSFDRIFQKTTTEPALCCIWEVGDSGALWTGPLIVGTTATSVQYTTQDTQQTVTYQNTFQYLGQTWYTSGYPDFLNAADHEDKLGYLQYLGSYPAVSDQIQAAKDLIDLAVINAGSLQAKLGNGLSFDANGAIQVTGGGGGSGDTVTEGAGIEITTDQQTGNKVIAVNAGTGLQVDQTTNELEIDDSVLTEDDELSLVFVPDDYQPS